MIRALFLWLSNATAFIAGVGTISTVLWLLLAIPRRTRAFAAWAIVFVYWTWAAWLWTTSVLTLLHGWGMVAVIVGLFFVGVGVVPLAFAQELIDGNWSIVATILMTLTGLFVARTFAAWLLVTVDADR